MSRFFRSPAALLAVFLMLSALPAAIPLEHRLHALASEVIPGGEQLLVHARPIPLYPDDPDRRDAGKLTYVGGLILNSPDKRFGGYSGLLIDKEGERFIAQSDRAYWLAGELIYRGGRLEDVGDTVLAPILGTDGRQLMAPRHDSESIAALGGFPGDGAGDVLVGFETVDRIERYALGSDGFMARPSPVSAPAEIEKNVPNKGLEGITALADGRLLAITEETLDEAGNAKGWIVTLDGEPAAPLSLKRYDPFDATDLARLPDGNVLVLERRYTRISGPGMRIRRIKKETIVPGAVLDGEILVELGVSSAIDNMEGLAVRNAGNGRVLLYVVSDDNQSAAQRTVLLEFELKD